MKKITLFLFASLFSALSFAALNPYAYGLSSTLSADQTTLTVNYSLNATATSVNVVILNGETVAKTVDCTSLGLTKGSYTTTIPTDELPKTTSLTWKVVVKGTSVGSPTKQSDQYSFYMPSSIAVDVDPESDKFGRWYAIEATRKNSNQTHTGYHTYEPNNNVRALYAFEATLDPIANASGTYGFTGGWNWGATETNVNGDYLNLWRVTTSGGRVFIGKYREGQTAVVEVDPADLGSNFTDVIPAGKRVVSITATGRGEDLKLVILDTNLDITEYDLGAASSVTSATPSRTYTQIVGSNKLTVRNDATITCDNVGGGIWLNQNREGTDLPTIAHITPDGVDYDNLSAGVSHVYCRNSGIAMSPDGSELAVVGAGAKKLTIYAVSKDAAGKISLTHKYTISTAGSNHTALSYDYAGNLYVANRSDEKINFYAMPYSGTVSTPCASKYAFELQESVGTIYTVTATASPAEAGTVAGAGEYAQDTEVTLTATANTGYRFENWTVGSNTETANPLTFTITENITATANFVALTPYTINATANDANMGTVTGGGTYYEGETVILTATPKTGYRFVNWSNSSTDAKLTFTASENLDLTANFEICTYTLTSFSNDETKGTVSGAGTYNYGATATLTATPTDGYKLLYWSDRSTENPRTITMTKNEAISAYFVKIYDEEPTFTITKLWENLDAPASTNNGYQAVGWDGKIYLKDRGNDVINVYSDATTSATYASTDSKDDQSIAVDDAGNLVLRSGSTNFYDAPKQVILYKKGETTYKTIDFTLPASGRCDFISASGDLFSAKGGYVYFYCQNQTTVSRLHVKNGGATAGDIVIDAVGAGITGGNSQSHVMVDIFGNLVTHSRTAAINKTINAYTGEATTFTLPNDQKAIALGGCSFELGGKEFWAYNVKGSDICNTEWNLYNMTDKKYLSNEILYVENNTDKNSAANWLNVQVVDENTAYIYQFCPTVAMAVWKVKMLSGPTLYTVTTTAENGTITGNAGTYEEGAEVTLTATPNRGYRFLNWTKGGEIVSTLPTYTFTITENIELVANFEALTPYTITVETSNAEQGSVTGGGTYYEGEEVTIKATAVGGFVFEKWSDDNTDNPRTITVNETATYTASFKVALARVFAYDLDVVDNGYETLTFSFIPNSNATSGRLIIYNGETTEQIYEEAITGPIAKGVKREITISRSLLPDSGTATWAIELTGDPIEETTLLTKVADKANYGFNRPQGVAIDNNPASDFFGRIYIALPKAGGSGYSDTNYGIVVMDPQHKRLKSGVVANGDALGANGRYSMHRVAVNPTNGHVYYVRTSDSSEGVTGTAIYELTPDATNILTDGGIAKNVISGASDITNANSVCFDETGAMYVMANANYDSGASLGRVYKVVDGVATLFTPNSIELASRDNAIVPDGKGGFWAAQHRDNFDTFSHLLHITAIGTVDYSIDKNSADASLLPVQPYTSGGKDYTNASYRGQVAYYSIDENNGLVAYGGGAKVSVFKVSYDGAGKPSLTAWQTISLLTQSTKAGVNVDGIAFDYAGNIIVMSATDERMYQYALPIETENTSIVPSPTSKTITLFATHNVQVTANNNALGTVTGSGEYKEGTTATLTATPNAGFRFVNWTKGGVEVSTDATYLFTVTEDVELVANFEVILLDTENNEGILTNLNDQTVDVAVYRSLTGGMYNTLCLPFDVNDLTGTPLENATIWQYNGATVKGDGTSKEIFLEFDEVESITAGKPYLVEPAEDIAAPMEFKDVTISVTNRNDVAQDAVTMHGVLHPTELEANNESILFLVENNNLAWANVTAYMKGMRAYFQVNEPSLQSARTRAYIRREPTVATDMENITTSETKIKKVIYNGSLYIIRGDEVYTIQGTKLK